MSKWQQDRLREFLIVNLILITSVVSWFLGNNMCGIVGSIGNDVQGFLQEALSRLQYRGYDSCGIAITSGNETSLQKSLTAPSETIWHKQIGEAGIAHCRWSTHGKPTIENAHPIAGGNNNECYVVHNGIIDNHLKLKTELIKKGYVFKTETDSEVIGHLFIELQKKFNMRDIASELAKQLTGQYAFVILFDSCLLAMSNGSPLYFSESGRIASDVSAFSGYDNQVYLVSKSYPLIITKSSVQLISHNKYLCKDTFATILEKLVVPPIKDLRSTNSHMLQEISEQSNIKTCNYVLDKPAKVVLFGCGSSYHAALMGGKYIESISGIPSEVRYAVDLEENPVLDNSQSTYFFALTQSGETKDTISALDSIKQHIDNKLHTVFSITNNPQSSIAQKSQHVIDIKCGTEQAVAATKSFTAQCLALLSIANSWEKTGCTLPTLDLKLESVMAKENSMEGLANKYKHYHNMLFLGRNMNYVIAKEAALKVKEVSYIHAEAVYSSEMKHGNIALIDDDTLSVFIVNKFDNRSCLHNMSEIKARNGEILIFCDEDTKEEVQRYGEVITVPNSDMYMAPLIINVLCQLFAYYLAVGKGINPDRPRSLAKSVTV